MINNNEHMKRLKNEFAAFSNNVTSEISGMKVSYVLLWWQMYIVYFMLWMVEMCDYLDEEWDSYKGRWFNDNM